MAEKAGGLAIVAVLIAALVFGFTPTQAAASTSVPAPTLDEREAGTSATAVLAGGCFWGVQGVFQHVKGVLSAESGYAGGDASTAQYETVGTGTTGHAESVRLTYDPQQVTFGQLLQVFFGVVHDPTQVDRQGPDTGPQYRSAIFPQNDIQRRVAEAYVAQLGQVKVFAAPIATHIEPATGFFPAEAYHQNYMQDHPDAPYIEINDAPKLDALRAQFPALYRDQPALVAT